VPHDFQVDTVSKGCSMVDAVVFANVPRWLNVILDLNEILCSRVLKSTVIQWGSQQKNFYLQGFDHSDIVPTCTGQRPFMYIQVSQSS
jgi:hypothetical protein